MAIFEGRAICLPTLLPQAGKLYEILSSLSFRRKPESMPLNGQTLASTWIPAFAGTTEFCGGFSSHLQRRRLARQRANPEGQALQGSQRGFVKQLDRALIHGDHVGY